MKKKVLRFMATALAAVMLVATIPAEVAQAALKEVSSPKQVTSFKSTTNFDKEYLHAKVSSGSDSVLEINYTTPLQTSLFRVSLYRVGENKSDLNLNIFVEPGYSFAADGSFLYTLSTSLDMEALEIEDGYYNLYLRRCATAEDSAALRYTNSGVLYKNMEIRVRDGKVKILRYKDVIDYNRSIMEIGENYATSLYLDNSLADINFVLRNPATDVYATMTYDKQSFIRMISDRVTAGAYTDYDKLVKIYEYTAANFYYDSVAFSTHSLQYADPYDNIRNFEYGLTSANSQGGRVYTTCQGYSAIFLALARAQGIPTRFVYGHRLAVPSNDWRTENNIDVRDHWWAESYVDGRWIFVDPTVGTTNKYDKNTGKWTTTGLTNYTYFDPTEDQIATSHVYMNIYPDYRYGKYIENPYEVSTLGAFLNQHSQTGEAYYETQSNGSIMDPAYNYYDKATWGDGTKSHFMTDGRGNVSQIQWSYKGFTGALNLPDFTTMTLLSSHHNEYESADLSGCTALEKLYLQDNQLKTIDLTDCRNLWYIRAQNNPTENLTLFINGKNRTFTSGENGHFYFTIDNRYVNEEFSLYSKPDIGYKLDGIYSTATGSKLSDKTSWHFLPKADGYLVNFRLDPDSYKYGIYPGNDQDYKVPYIQAAAKRLAALGYYSPDPYAGLYEDLYGFYYGGYSSYGSSAGTQTEAGTETSYTDQMMEAVIRFQVMHNLPNTGNLGEMTWSALFNETAKPMVSEAEYQQILADYEASKAAEEAAKTEAEAARQALDSIKIKAASAAAPKSMTITWTPSIMQEDEDGNQQAANEAYTTLLLAKYVDGYEVWKSTSKTEGYEKVRTTGKLSYKNTKGLKKGTRYYYKVRAYKQVGEETLYSDWSTITYRKAK
ncbi:MAG: peptidoglycan-binding protein [Firmicutes bacterium]|nr:peptidoglycan-binding protein [Bacillota bacterium]